MSEKNDYRIDKTKIEYFSLILLKWYNTNKREFPWRHDGISAYEVIISEVLLQRTKASTIAEFFHSFLKNYPSWKSISDSSHEDLEKELKPIGLYKQRAKRLKSLANFLLLNGGILPDKYDQLLSLPQIGQYIANAVMSILYDKAYPMLDVNMARVLERFFGPRKLSDIRFDPYLQYLAYLIMPKNNSKIMNWAILDFGAKVCIARNPKCRYCLLSAQCLFFNNQ